MKKMLIRRITRQQEKTCFNLCHKYYPRREQGKSLWDIRKPRYYKLLLQRFFLVFISVFRFRADLYKPYFAIFKETSFPLLESGSQSLFILRWQEFFFRLFGLRRFVKETYLGSWYEKALPLEALHFANHPQPEVSIIIPIHNQVSLTLGCLRALQTHTQNVACEVIIIDDLSTDETAALIPAIEGIRYYRNEKNLGFLRSCNFGISTARGRYICFLNNDTLVQGHWLSYLLKTFALIPGTGAVGAKLIYPYGLLQEAGGIIWPDASGANYGKFDHPLDQRYNFAREVDYCSGACLLIEKTTLEQLGGFDGQFAPAYYEDTDLCFSIRHKLGKKVIYQSAAQVVHLEGASSGKIATAGNVKSYQDKNRELFLQKWHRELAQYDLGHDQYRAARKYFSPSPLIVIDSYLPRYDKESGSRRLYEIMKIMLLLKQHVVFIPADAFYPEPYYSEMMSRGIEMIYRYAGNRQLQREIKRVTKEASVAWICRPEYNERYQFLFDINTRLKWIYDTVDIHYLRLNRAKGLFPAQAKKLDKKIAHYFDVEISMAKRADVTIAITKDEQQELLAQGGSNVVVVPNIHPDAQQHVPGFQERGGILFIGSYVHHPNADAAVWLCREIMPLLWKTEPSIKLTLAGANPTEEIMALQSEHITVTGFVEDVSPYFQTARVFVSPLRYGAGMKGKIGQALEYSLPVVSTSIGSEGMDIQDGFNYVLANSAEEIAAAILRIYQSEQEWGFLSRNCASALEKYRPAAVAETIKALI